MGQEIEEGYEIYNRLTQFADSHGMAAASRPKGEMPYLEDGDEHGLLRASNEVLGEKLVEYARWHEFVVSKRQIVRIALAQAEEHLKKAKATALINNHTVTPADVRTAYVESDEDVVKARQAVSELKTQKSVLSEDAQRLYNGSEVIKRILDGRNRSRRPQSTLFDGLTYGGAQGGASSTPNPNAHRPQEVPESRVPRRPKPRPRKS